MNNCRIRKGGHRCRHGFCNDIHEVELGLEEAHRAIRTLLRFAEWQGAPIDSIDWEPGTRAAIDAALRSVEAQKSREEIDQ